MIHVAAQFFLNHRLKPAQLQELTREIAEAGYEGIFGEARYGLLTPFMSAAWWDGIDALVSTCRETGMEYWIWDEDLFPSGTAGGRITGHEPGLLPQALRLSVHEVEGEGPFEVTFCEGQLLRAYAVAEDGTCIDISDHCGTLRTTWGKRWVKHGAYSPMIDVVGPPHWRASQDDIRFCSLWTPPKPGRYTLVAGLLLTCPGIHADILNPLSFKRFLDYCYEPYAARFGAELGQTIKGVFTDEPSPGAGLYPWTTAFATEFEADHGYDVLAAIPHLALNIDASSPACRHHYRQTQFRLQKAAYGDQIGAWCREHGLTFAGHLTRTEWLSLVAAWWPNELRMYESFDLPCADPLGAAAGWADAASYHSGLKVVSSAAHLFGRDRCGTDANAVIGEEAGIRDLRYMLDYQMVLGINFFSLHGLNISNEAERKDEVPPSLFFQHPEWPYMGELTRHTRDVCRALTGGTHACRLAVLYPSTSLAAQLLPKPAWPHLDDELATHRLVDGLLSHQRDFDFIDEVTLQEASEADGTLTTPEPYEVILLAYQRFIEAETAACLERFAGRVVAIGCKPRLIDRQGMGGAREWQAAIEVAGELTLELAASLPGNEVKGKGAREVFVLQRRNAEGEEVRFAFNRAETAFEGTIDGRQAWIAPRGSVLMTGADEAPYPLARVETVAELSRDWTLRLGDNQLALGFWHIVKNDDVYSFVGPYLDLLNREPVPEAELAAPVVRFACRLMTVGQIESMQIEVEKGAIGGAWRLLVNDVEVTEWEEPTGLDVDSRRADIAGLLRCGGSPMLNVVTVETRGEGRNLREMPYLIGGFTVDFRHGHHSLPYLTAAPTAQQLKTLQSWNAIGYGSYSGIGEYRRTVSIAEAGDYVLDLGRVEDVAEVLVDGREAGVAAWTPYVCRLGELAAGEHELTVRVANPAANRTRLANRTAGWLGPVRLCRSL